MSNFKFNNNGILAIWNRVLVLLKMITGDVDVIGKGTIQDQLDYLYTHDSSHKTVTTEEFNAMSEEEKNNGTIYFISDGTIGGGATNGDGSVSTVEGADPDNILDVGAIHIKNAPAATSPFNDTDSEGNPTNDFILQTYWYKDETTGKIKANQLAFNLIDGTIKNRVFDGTTWQAWSEGFGGVTARSSRNFFVGTQAEFDEAYDNNELDVGAIVILTDQEEEYVTDGTDTGVMIVDGSFSTTSIHAIQNKPVAIKFGEVDAEIAALKKTSGVTVTQVKTLTTTGLQAVDAVELNSSVDGTLANQIASINTKIENIETFKNYNRLITVNEDLNDITEPGHYICSGDAICATLLHKPKALQYAFYMDVKYPLTKSGVNFYVTQSITNYTTGDQFYRHVLIKTDGNNNWGKWYQSLFIEET